MGFWDALRRFFAPANTAATGTVAWSYCDGAHRRHRYAGGPTCVRCGAERRAK